VFDLGEVEGLRPGGGGNGHDDLRAVQGQRVATVCAGASRHQEGTGDLTLLRDRQVSAESTGQ